MCISIHIISVFCFLLRNQCFQEAFRFHDLLNSLMNSLQLFFCLVLSIVLR